VKIVKPVVYTFSVQPLDVMTPLDDLMQNIFVVTGFVLTWSKLISTRLGRKLRMHQMHLLTWIIPFFSISSTERKIETRDTSLEGTWYSNIAIHMQYTNRPQSFGIHNPQMAFFYQ
jgi:hypothetical protein